MTEASAAKRSSLSGLVDLAERQRQEGRHAEALSSVNRCLKQEPNHARASLLLARLLYQDGRPLQALAALGPVRVVLGQDEGLKTIAAGLARLGQERNSRLDPAFATESMAGLLVEQRYILEALEIYRQLFLARPAEKRLWETILSLKERLGQEGSRDASRERISRELEALDRWIQTKQSED